MCTVLYKKTYLEETSYDSGLYMEIIGLQYPPARDLSGSICLKI